MEKYSIIRDDSDFEVYGIMKLPDGVKIDDVQDRIYEIRDKYYYNADGWTENGEFWFDHAISIIGKEFGAEVLDISRDIYY